MGIFRQRTILERLKKAAIVLVFCLLGIWLTWPSPPDGNFSVTHPRLTELRQQLEKAKAEEEARFEEDATRSKNGEPPSPFVNTVSTIFGLQNEIKRIENILREEQRSEGPRATFFEKLLAIIFAVSLWLYLIAHTFDAGFRKDEEDEEGGSFEFRYLCTRETLKENVSDLAGGLGLALVQAIRAKLSTQVGFIAAIGIAFLGVILIRVLHRGDFEYVYGLAVGIMCISTWLLLGWFLWCRPLQIKWREIHSVPSEDFTYVRGNQLVEMPSASCSSPAPPETPVVEGRVEETPKM